MKKFYQALGFSFLFIFSVNASTLSELEKLEAYKFENGNKSHQKSENEVKEERRFITLSNGKTMDITDWQIVHFMSSDCNYCKQFNPILKQISNDTKIPVFTYSFDGRGDEFFENPFPVNSSIINAFFAELPRATPTDFIVNVNSLITLPLSQGITSYNSFLQRLDEVFIYVDTNLSNF